MTPLDRTISTKTSASASIAVPAASDLAIRCASNARPLEHRLTRGSNATTRTPSPVGVNVERRHEQAGAAEKWRLAATLGPWAQEPWLGVLAEYRTAVIAISVRRPK